MAEVYLDIIARMDKFQTDLNSVKKGMTDLQHKSEEVNNTVRKEFESTGQVANQLRGFIAGAFSIGAITAFVKKMIDLRSEWEKQTAVIKTLTGSQKEAEATMKMIKKVADASLSPLKEVSDAYIRLVNQGIKPSYSEMKKMTDVAVSAGRSFGQLAEAIFDATNGQMRGLEDFKIQSKIVGDKIQLSFKGMTESVDLTGESIADFVIKAGELNGVAGASEAINTTMAGSFDNLGDSIETVVLELGKLTDKSIVDVVNSLNNIVTVMGFLTKSANDTDSSVIKLMIDIMKMANPLILLNKGVSLGYEKIADAIRKTDEEMEDVKTETEDTGETIEEFTLRIRGLIKEMAKGEPILPGIIGQLNYELKKLNEELIIAPTEEKIAELTLRIKELEAEIKRLMSLGEIMDVKKIKIEDLDLSDINKQADEFIEDLNKEWSEQSDNLTKELRDKRELEIKDDLEATLQHEEDKRRIIDATYSFIMGSVDALSQYRQQKMNEELAAAGDNEKKKEDIRRKYAKKEQNIEIARAIMGVAGVVINALQTKPFIPAGLAASILAGILGGIQIGVIKSQKFATGILDLQGRGTGTSDEIPSMLSRGESVMTAHETKEYYPYLKAMKDGKFPKLQLELMKDYVTNNNLTYDNSKEIKELREIRRELSKERTIEYVEGKYKIVKRGGITTKISLN